ncbi:MAG: GNAT family N-acetyltransferase [Eubacteriales bacterium]
MDRKIYISDKILSLAEYIKADDINFYNNWMDTETQNGYNFILKETFEEFSSKEIKQRFLFSIILNKTGYVIGHIGLSPENTPPDLAIWIYKQYRNKSYGTQAFSLGVRYCFEVLKLEKIYAGCYPHNKASYKMLMKCGFTPNPSGNIEEKHYLTGEPLTQFDYVLYNPILII